MFYASFLVRILSYKFGIKVHHIRKIMIFTRLFQENKEQATSSFGIVVGHVVVLKRYLETFCQRSQTMTFVFWIKISCQFKRINNWLRNRWHAMTFVVSIHKSNVKGCIVGNKNGIFTEILEHLKHLLNWFSVSDMIICNTSQFCCKG